MTLTGELILGSKRVAAGEPFYGYNPATGEKLETGFSNAGREHVEKACALADEAFDTFRELSPQARAEFLETVAKNIEALGDELIVRTMAETGLPRPRIEGERGRTTGQLRLFANTLRRGDWLGVRVDNALPERTPLPRPDLRMRKIPVGPVVIFGASNFPLAFSVAGGDTASAFAAGCPVVFKGHSAHPGTSELVGRAIMEAVKAHGLPEGVFSLLSGKNHELGGSLVADPRIKAAAFTGSRGGGTALAKIAAARAEPIPVYAEMSSINPIFLLPHALETRAEQMGAAFAASLTMGAGQFCTNPGLLFGIASPGLDRFIAAASAALSEAPNAAMLTAGILESYAKGVDKLAQNPSVETVVKGGRCDTPHRARAALFTTQSAQFIKDHAMHEEVFGASGLLVRCASEAEFLPSLNALEGQLTASLHMDKEDHPIAARLLPTLERKAGRIIANAWPTGVEVSEAMVHGGPYPSTMDGRSTSVGTLAIERFLRPVCYQSMPADLLPAAVSVDNKLGVPRLVDGAWTKA